MTDITTFQLTAQIENPRYVNYLSARFAKTYNNTTLGSLIGNIPLQKGYKWLFQVLGAEATDETICFSVKAEQESFSSFMGATLCAKDGVLGIGIGGDFYPLPIDPKGKFNGVLKVADGDEEEVEYGFEKVTIGGYEEIAFKISLTRAKGEKTLTMVLYCPLRLEDYKKKKDLKLEDLSTYLKRSHTKLIGLLAAPPEISNFDGDTISVDQLPYPLEEGFTHWDVVKFKAVNMGSRVSYLMEIRGEISEENDMPMRHYLTKNEDGSKGDPVAFERVQVWANKPLVPFFQSEPEITEENPAKLIIREVKEYPTKSGKIQTFVDTAIRFESPSTAVMVDPFDFEF